MVDNGGIGLTATQVGIDASVFVIRTDPIICCFNPSIRSISEEEEMMDEGCLSYPGLYFKIRRPKTVRLSFQTPNGATTAKTFEGLTARVVLHEMCHIRGEKFFQDMSNLKREMAVKRARKRGFTYNLKSL